MVYTPFSFIIWLVCGLSVWVLRFIYLLPPRNGDTHISISDPVGLDPPSPEGADTEPVPHIMPADLDPPLLQEGIVEEVPGHNFGQPDPSPVQGYLANLPEPVILGISDPSTPPEGDEENNFSELSEGSETLPFVRGIFQDILSEVLGIVDTIPPPNMGDRGL